MYNFFSGKQLACVLQESGKEDMSLACFGATRYVSEVVTKVYEAKEGDHDATLARIMKGTEQRARSSWRVARELLQQPALLNRVEAARGNAAIDWYVISLC